VYQLVANKALAKFEPQCIREVTITGGAPYVSHLGNFYLVLATDARGAVMAVDKEAPVAIINDLCLPVECTHPVRFRVGYMWPQMLVVQVVCAIFTHRSEVRDAENWLV
jgi:hypothetical protein